jgi:hypothetical protein
MKVMIYEKTGYGGLPYETGKNATRRAESVYRPLEPHSCLRGSSNGLGFSILNSSHHHLTKTITTLSHGMHTESRAFSRLHLGLLPAYSSSCPSRSRGKPRPNPLLELDLTLLILFPLRLRR